MVQLIAAAKTAAEQATVVPVVPTPTVDINNFIVLLGVGLAVGVGLMVLGLAKFGQKLFSGNNHAVSQATPPDEEMVHTFPCKYAKDQAMIKKYMEDQDRERKDMWQFLGTINNTQLEMKGKLDLLLQGARVRWNQGLIPPEERKA